jgi:hypothetical protein
MLRVVAVLLVMANLAYFAWTQGMLASIGLLPAQQTEPERLKEQIQPATLRLLNGPRSEAPPTAETPAPVAVEASAAAESPAETAPDSCWQAAGFTPAQADKLGEALSGLGLAESQWRFTEVRSAGRWVVFMGRYNDEQMEKKKAELRELKIEFREVSLPSTGPGLALGTFSSEEAVQQGLKDVARKGVRSARMAVERPEAVTLNLRLPAITEAQRNSIQGLGGVLAGKTLQACS